MKTEKYQIKYEYLQSLFLSPVWIFHDFYITQILREINFGDSTRAISAIFAILETLNFDFYEFFHLLKAEMYQINKIQSS